jgi:hypothetical protein
VVLDALTTLALALAGFISAGAKTHVALRITFHRFPPVYNGINAAGRLEATQLAIDNFNLELIQQLAQSQAAYIIFFCQLKGRLTGDSSPVSHSLQFLF